MLTTPRTTSRDFLWEQTLRMFRVASRAAVPKKSRLVARGGVTAFGTPLRSLFLCALCVRQLRKHPDRGTRPPRASAPRPPLRLQRRELPLAPCSGERPGAPRFRTAASWTMRTVCLIVVYSTSVVDTPAGEGYTADQTSG